jgi:hypothetical protein
MVSDFRILGVAEGADEESVKAAYRHRVKEVHPDHSSDENAFTNHLLFIQINQAYRRVLKKLAERPRSKPDDPASPPPRARAPKPAMPQARPLAPEGGPGIVPHRDPAWVYYKTATTYFEQIHPAKWSLDTTRQLKRPVTPEDAKEQAEMRGIVQDLIRLFPKAYYYYSLVVDEYPDSVWSADASDKMRLIEDRTRLYKKILDSFGVWDRSGPYRTFKPVGT